MGRSLDELAAVGYLSEWDLKLMTSKEGYKLVLLPGKQLAHVLALSVRKQLEDSPGTDPQWSDEQAEALKTMEDRGISRAKAIELLGQFSAALIQDQIEYADHLLASDRRRKVDNPAGFIIYD